MKPAVTVDVNDMGSSFWLVMEVAKKGPPNVSVGWLLESRT